MTVVALCGGVNASQALASEIPEGSIGIRLTDVASVNAADPRAQLYITDQVSPGSTLVRHFEVSSTAPGTVAISEYAAAAHIEKNKFVGEAAHTANELSSWITVTPQKAEIIPGGIISGTVSIAVPADAEAGERYAIVWAQTETNSTDQPGISLINRVGIRVYLSIGPGGNAPSNFEITNLSSHRSMAGIPSVTATVINTGQRALDLSGELLLSSGPGKLSGGPFPARLGTTLAIGEKTEILVPLNTQLPDGPWNATLTLRSGSLEKTVQATITFPGAGSSSTTPVIADWLVLYGPYAGGALLLLALALWFIFRRRSALKSSQRIRVHRKP